VQHETSLAIGLELTHSMPGRARDDLKTRPVWCLIDEAMIDGDGDALRLWHEWEKSSKGKRQVGWSRGLRDRFAPDVSELTDEDVVDLETGTADDDLLLITKDGWRVLCARPSSLPEVLEATEWGGDVALRAVLDRYGATYREVHR